MGEIQLVKMFWKVSWKLIKFIPWVSLVWYGMCQNLWGIHPINSFLTSIKKPPFSLLLVVDFHANSCSIFGYINTWKLSHKYIILHYLSVWNVGWSSYHVGCIVPYQSFLSINTVISTAFWACWHPCCDCGLFVLVTHPACVTGLEFSIQRYKSFAPSLCAFFLQGIVVHSDINCQCWPFWYSYIWMHTNIKYL